MTRSSAATVAGHARKVRRSTAPRRVSGAARTPTGRGRARAATATRRAPFAGLTGFAPRRISGGAVALPAPRRRARAADGGLARRLGALVEHPWLDKLLSGRLWIAIIAVGLIGLVFMQVSLLKLNAGMGAAVERGEVLSRENAVLRADVSKLEAPDRIQQLALGAGMVLPTADQVTFLGEDGRRMSGAEKPSDGQASTATLPVTPQEQAAQAQGTAATAPTSAATPAATSAPAATTTPPPTAQTPTQTASPATGTATPGTTGATATGTTAPSTTATGTTGAAGPPATGTAGTPATGTTGAAGTATTTGTTGTATGGAVAGG